VPENARSGFGLSASQRQRLPPGIDAVALERFVSRFPETRDQIVGMFQADSPEATPQTLLEMQVVRERLRHAPERTRADIGRARTTVYSVLVPARTRP
jgi:hypothetical protein